MSDIDYERAGRWLRETLADHEPTDVEDLSERVRGRDFGSVMLWELWNLIGSGVVILLPDYRVQLA